LVAPPYPRARCFQPPIFDFHTDSAIPADLLASDVWPAIVDLISSLNQQGEAEDCLFIQPSGNQLDASDANRREIGRNRG
jgi:hypothetical protein